MKKTFIILFVLISNINFSQCNCGSSTSFSQWSFDPYISTSNQGRFGFQFITDTRLYNRSNKPINAGMSQNVYSGTDDSMLSALHIDALQFTSRIRRDFFVTLALPVLSRLYGTKGIVGITDASLSLGKAFILKRQSMVTIVFGLEMPTGQGGAQETNTSLNYGSKTWDPLVNLLFQKQINLFEARFAITGKYNTSNSSGSASGNFTSQSISVLYQLSKLRQSCSGDSLKTKGSWSLVSGLWNEVYFKSTEKHIVNQNSGGYVNYISLGAMINKKKISFATYVEKPFRQNWATRQNELTFRIRMALTYKI